MGKLDGKVAIITGAARGLGRSHASTFAEEGADIVASDICHDLPRPNYSLGTREELDRTVEEVQASGRRAIGVECDTRDPEQVEAMVDRCVREFGKVDILVNNAGFWHGVPAHEMTKEEWDLTIDTILKGSWYGCRYVVPHMIYRRSGVIINTASVFALKGFGNCVHYVAAQHGILGLTRSLAVEMAEFGIRVNCVCCGHVDTAMVEGAAADFGMDGESFEDTLLKTVLLPELLTPEEVSKAFLWLASDEGRLVTATAFLIDQGFMEKFPT